MRVFGCVEKCRDNLIYVRRHTDHQPKFCISPSSIRNSRNPQTCQDCQDWPDWDDGMRSPSPPMVKHWLPQMAVCLVGLMFQHTTCADESLLAPPRARSACCCQSLTINALLNCHCLSCQACSPHPMRSRANRKSIPQISQLRSVDVTPGRLSHSDDPRPPLSEHPASQLLLLWPAPLSRISPELCRR